MPMIRPENLRSGYIQDDVEEYLYSLLPKRDAVLEEIEDFAAKNGVPIIGPAVARFLSLLVQISGAKRIFEMGDGEIFHVITNGWNLMQPYGSQVDVPDRWAIVAYVRALQLARLGNLDDVPENQRATLSK